MAYRDIRLSDIEPNPFRGLAEGQYTLDADKVAALIESFGRTGYWGNVVVRPHPAERGRYQLGYGHHRLQALLDEHGPNASHPFIVRDLSDTDMLRMMADENDDLYQSSTQSDVTALHALLEGWATGTIEDQPEQLPINPSKGGTRQSHTYTSDRGPRCTYVEADVRRFFGWGERKAAAAIHGFRLVMEGYVDQTDLAGMSTRKTSAIASEVKAAKATTDRAVQSGRMTERDARASVKRVARAAIKAAKDEAKGTADISKAGAKERIKHAEQTEDERIRALLKGIKVSWSDTASSIEALTALLRAHPELMDAILGHAPTMEPIGQRFAKLEAAVQELREVIGTRYQTIAIEAQTHA